MSALVRPGDRPTERADGRQSGMMGTDRVCRVVVRESGWLWLVLPVWPVAVGGCHRQVPAVPPTCRPAEIAEAPVTAAADKDSKDPKDPPEPPPRPLLRCFPDQPSWVDAPVADLLDRASERFDHGDYAGTLACAEEAARQAPRSVEAHHNRAIALMHLDRLDEARDALELALALAPDDPQTLEAAADLHINQLPPSGARASASSNASRASSSRSRCMSAMARVWWASTERGAWRAASSAQPSVPA